MALLLLVLLTVSYEHLIADFLSPLLDSTDDLAEERIGEIRAYDAYCACSWVSHAGRDRIRDISKLLRFAEKAAEKLGAKTVLTNAHPVPADFLSGADACERKA